MSTPSPALFLETVNAYQRTAALRAAIDLEIFTAIGEGANTAADVSKRCTASERGTRILCDYLTVFGFLTKSGDKYQLTQDSAIFLTKQSQAYLGDLVKFLNLPHMKHCAENLTETVRRGTVSSADSIMSAENAVWVEFARSMVPLMVPSANAIAEILGGASAGTQRVLDLAAGHGIFGITIAQKNPKAEVVAVDWPNVLPVAEENARARGVQDRFGTIPGDAFKVDYRDGYDIALVTNFLHHLDKATCASFLRKVAAAVKPGGRVVVLEFIPNEDRVSPPFPAAFALTMLAETPGGDAYTRKELDELLGSAGFKNVTAHALPSPQVVLIATK